jgi:hypothetical protein
LIQPLHVQKDRLILVKAGFVDIWEEKDVRLAVGCQAIVQLNHSTALELAFFSLPMGRRALNK